MSARQAAAAQLRRLIPLVAFGDLSCWARTERARSPTRCSSPSTAIAIGIRSEPRTPH